MATQELRYDPEDPKSTGSYDLTSWRPSVPALFFEAACFLTVWSVLVINEGAIRLIDSRPASGFTTGMGPPNLLLMLGGLAEVIFGMVGLAVGVAAAVFRAYDTMATKIAMGIQTLLGYFVFAVFVFVVPIYTAIDVDEQSLMPGFSLGQQRYFVVLGLFTSFHFCLALQGGQFVFLARLIAGATGKDFLKQTSGNRMRAMFWNSNLGWAGLYTLITGALVNSNVGGGRLEVPYESPPNVGVLPGLTITTGLVMMLWGFLAAIAVYRGYVLPKAYYWMSMVVYLLAYLNFTIVQLGLINAPVEGPSPLGGPTALHGGLVFMVVFLGPYFAWQEAKERESAH